jgi:hypothetical protein
LFQRRSGVSPERLPWQLEVSPRFFIFCTIETVSNVGR